MGWMTSSGVSMHYEVSGRGQRSLILVHELGGTLDSWDAVLPLLEPEFRVLRFDQRGSGLSEKVRKAFTIDDHVQDLQNILEVVELPPPYYLAGMAAGAAVVLGFVHRRGAEAAAAVLCAAATDVGPDRRQFLLDRAELACREGMRAVADMTLARSFPQPCATIRRCLKIIAAGCWPTIRCATRRPIARCSTPISMRPSRGCGAAAWCWRVRMMGCVRRKTSRRWRGVCRARNSRCSIPHT